MEFKNIEIINIANALTNIYNCSKTAKQRFYIANVADDFLHKSSMLKIEINKIIEDEGNVEDGKKKLEITNEHYVGLMDGVTKIEFDKVPLSLLNDIDVQINDIIAIKKIIKEGD